MAENSTGSQIQSGEQPEVVDQAESYNPEAEDENLGVFGFDSQDDFVDHQSEEEAEEAGESEERSGSEGAGQNSKQTHEDNAAARQARLRAQREAEKLIEAEKQKMQLDADRRIAESGVVNPYTGKPFTSVKEFEEYGSKVKTAELEKKAKESGRSVAELREEEENKAYIRKKRQEESAAAEQNRQQEAEKNFFQKDLMDFMEKHPDVDVEKLDSNPQFRRFCGSRYGKEPLAELYESYVDIVGESQRQGADKAKSKASRSTGSGQPGGEGLTARQKRDLERWNADNPDMAMTPKEFLSRE